METAKGRLGFALCGSFCTLHRGMEAMESLAASGLELVPIVSESVYETDTRFGTAAEHLMRIETCCGRKVIHTIAKAEPLGPREPLDALIVAPCTGNTLAKIAQGITDTPVTMAIKAHLRNCRPLIIALASNDALSGNLASIAAVSGRKNVYFVPLGQDDPIHKPWSLVADFSLIPSTLFAAFSGIQIQPVLTRH